MKMFIIIGSLNALIGVGLGAFGAHKIKTKFSQEMLTVWETAVQYHLIHALGLILIAILCQLMPEASLLLNAGWLFLGGIVLFSGSLYAMVLTGNKGLGIITPMGGVAFLLGWLSIAVDAFKLGS